MSDPWRLEVSSHAAKDLRQVDPANRRRVADALERLAADPYAGDIRKLAGTNEWRLRVGDLRVRFLRDAAARTIVVRQVLPRDRAYRR